MVVLILRRIVTYKKKAWLRVLQEEKQARARISRNYIKDQFARTAKTNIYIFGPNLVVEFTSDI